MNKVFKFGGASIKDAQGIRNVVAILASYQDEVACVVVSAMGKTTNKLEKIIQAAVTQSNNFSQMIDTLEKEHQDILSQLVGEDTAASHRIHELFENVRGILNHIHTNSSFLYDQVVAVGEMASTTIVHAYLVHQNLEYEWIDARKLILTNDRHRDATVDWDQTGKAIRENITGKSITQGFIGGTNDGVTTTLGREGSDYSAAIIAYFLQATGVTIWKDVPGVLNADPREFDNTELLESISYREAIELAYYGASVIHPKTLQPLQHKKIPLQVRSFIKPETAGTVIQEGEPLVPNMPCFIVKKNMTLLSIAALDFSFIGEDNVSHIFELLAQYKMQVGLIQASAISFSICVDDRFDNRTSLLSILKKQYKVTYNENVRLYTVRHYDQDSIATIETRGEVIIKQVTRETVQVVIK